MRERLSLSVTVSVLTTVSCDIGGVFFFRTKMLHENPCLHLKPSYFLGPTGAEKRLEVSAILMA